MSYTKQLTQFFFRAAHDDLMSSTKVALFIALLYKWSQTRFQGSLQVNRDEIMLLAKISSRATYHRSMTFLHKHNYIFYTPSFNPHRGSIVDFFTDFTKLNNNSKTTKNVVVQNLSSTIKNIPVQNLSSTIKFKPVQNLSTSIPDEPNKLYSKLYSKKEITNIIKNNISRANNQKSKDDLKKNGQVITSEKEKNFVKKEKDIATVMPPVLMDVENFFTSNNSTILEAQKYFNYYTANGWLIGGRSAMKNWKAAARNWIVNSAQYTHRNAKQAASNDRAKHLNSNNDKDYSEPL